jgi:hypothetical protein
LFSELFKEREMLLFRIICDYGSLDCSPGMRSLK